MRHLWSLCRRHGLPRFRRASWAAPSGGVHAAPPLRCRRTSVPTPRVAVVSGGPRGPRRAAVCTPPRRLAAAVGEHRPDERRVENGTEMVGLHATFAFDPASLNGFIPPPSTFYFSQKRTVPRRGQGLDPREALVEHGFIDISGG
eukprot:3974208-Prymnesium_polylepis.1